MPRKSKSRLKQEIMIKIYYQYLDKGKEIPVTEAISST